MKLDRALLSSSSPQLRALLGLLLLGASLSAQAATITVNQTTCTLVDAITAANTDAAVNGSQCTAGSGDDTIVLAPNTPVTLTAVNNDVNGLPLITSVITIQGNGNTLSRSSAQDTPDFRLFYVDTTGTLTLEDLTLSGGRSPSQGGGIFNGGVLTLTRCLVSGNSALGSSQGGGIFAGGTVRIQHSSLINNVSGGRGGALFVQGGTATLINSTLAQNQAADGGGFSNSSGTHRLQNSTLTGNLATNSGGGIYQNGGTVNLTNTLVAGNSAAQGREILRQGQSTLTLNGYNLLGHSGSTAAQAFQGNIPPGATDIVATSTAQGAVATHTPTALGSILELDSTVDPAVPAVKANNGPTPTVALVTGSPALNAADPLFTDSTPTAGTAQRRDQRNFVLADGDTRRDIGAFEFNGVPPPDCKIGTDQASAYVTPGTLTCKIPTDFTATQIKATVVGAGGGIYGDQRSQYAGGNGAVGISSTFSVKAGDLLTVTVGQRGESSDRVPAITAGGLSQVVNANASSTQSMTSNGGGKASSGGKGGDGSASTNGVTLDADSPTSWNTWPDNNKYKDNFNYPVGSSGPTTGGANGMVLLSLAIPAPTVTALSPTSGATTGGTSVTITGTNLTGATAVKFGTNAATSFTLNSATSITAVAPAGSAGTVNVSVTTGGGTSSTTGTADDFTYVVSAPGACGISSGLPTATAPSSNLCGTGSAGTVSSTGGQWAWMCNGTGGNTTNVACAAPFATQSLSLSASATAIFVNGTSTISASSDKGLKPTINIASTASASTACSRGTQSDTATGVEATVTGTAAGTCTLEATIAKSADGCTACYQGADATPVDLTVSQKTQTITLGAPEAISHGSTGTVSASSDSGLEVTVTSQTSSICSVAKTVSTARALAKASSSDSYTVTPIAAGSCTVAGTQAGNTEYAAASPVTATILINAVTPGAPTGLSATAGNRSATISFTAGSSGGAPITNYEYSLNEGPYTALTPAVTASPVQINGLTNGTAYAIVLRAVNSAGPGTASAVVNVTPRASGGGGGGGGTPPPVAPTSAPGSVSASAGDSQATLSFEVPAGTTNLQYSLDGGQTFRSFDPPIATSPVTIPGLSNGTLYSIVLRALNSAGTGPASAPVTVMPFSDSDSDGLASTVEDPVPNAQGTGTGDGNGDGLKDSDQNYVASFTDPNGQYSTLASSASKPLSQVVAVSPPSDFPTDAGSVLSGVAFRIGGLDLGGTTDLELYLDRSRGTVTGLRKKNLRTGQWDTIPAVIRTVGNKTQIVYSLTDGGDYDSDGVTNGQISDPVYVVGTPAAPAGNGGGGGSFGWLTLLPMMLAARRRKRR